MTLRHPHITFEKPLKIHDTLNDIYEVYGVYQYFDSILVHHSNGYTDLKWIGEESRVKIEEKIKGIK